MWKKAFAASVVRSRLRALRSLAMDESWLLDGLGAFYLGFLTGLLVVPLCVELGCIFRGSRRSTVGRGAAYSQSVPDV